MSKILLTATALVLMSSKLVAQTCLGLPDHRSAPINLGVNFEKPRDVTGASARLGFTNGTLFGGLAAAHSNYDRVGSRRSVVALDGGIQLSLNKSKSFELCPIVRAVYQWGPGFNIDPAQFKTSAYGGDIGLSLGFKKNLTSSISIIPTGSFFYSMRSTETTVTGSLANPLVQIANSGKRYNTDGATASAGARLLFSERLSVGFGVAVQFDDSNHPGYSLSLGLGFPRRK